MQIQLYFLNPRKKSRNECMTPNELWVLIFAEVHATEVGFNVVAILVIIYLEILFGVMTKIQCTPKAAYMLARIPVKNAYCKIWLMGPSKQLQN